MNSILYWLLCSAPGVLIYRVFGLLITTMQILPTLCSIAIVLGTPIARQNDARTVTRYESPDKAIVATVTSSKAPEATDESHVSLRSKTGKLLADTDYSSEDGEHGYGVTKAMWTPDSQFFIYSLESSGGHSAWHSPVQFYSRRQRKIQSLDDALNDAILNPQFVVGYPDKVTVELYFTKRKVTVSLSSLLKRPESLRQH